MGIVHRSLRRPHLAGRLWLRNIGDRVGQGRDTASEPDPDIGSAPVHRLEDRDRLAFLHPLADQRRALGADIAQLNAALAEDGNVVLVVRVGRLQVQPDRCPRRTPFALHRQVLLLSSSSGK